MFEERTRLIIQDKYVDLVEQVIDELRDTDAPEELEQANYSHFWEAFCEQFQDDDEQLDAYTDVISEACQRMVDSLTLTELKLLWLVSEGCADWVEDDDFPDDEQMQDDVTDELISWVEQEAEEPELVEDDAE